MNFKIGFGYDVHRLVEGRKLWIGGVEVPFEKGALGHSDADALLHAICDALFGAAGLEDIGTHFPDNDSEFKDIDSKILLKKTVELIREKGYTVGNVDATVVLEKPKLKPHIPAIRSLISEILKIAFDDVTIKATTNEQMGFIGRGEGIGAHAVCLIYKK